MRTTVAVSPLIFSEQDTGVDTEVGCVDASPDGFGTVVTKDTEENIREEIRWSEQKGWFVRICGRGEDEGPDSILDRQRTADQVLWEEFLSRNESRLTFLEFGTGGGRAARVCLERGHGQVPSHAWKGRNGLRGILALAKEKQLGAIWIHPPGGTLGKGHRPVCRGKQSPNGFADLAVEMEQKVRAENSEWEEVLRVLRNPLLEDVPVLITHAATSHLPRVGTAGGLAKLEGFSLESTDLCGFGNPWKGSTSVWVRNCDAST